jgi:uncharacterized membrane protein
MNQRIQRAEVFISLLLKWGVIVCVCLIGLGWVLSFTSPRVVLPNPGGLSCLKTSTCVAPLSVYSSPGEFTRALMEPSPHTWMTLGLMILILLPVLRVGLTVILFVVQKDVTYIFLSSVVFAILIISTFLGRAI